MRQADDMIIWAMNWNYQRIVSGGDKDQEPKMKEGIETEKVLRAEKISQQIL